MPEQRSSLFISNPVRLAGSVSTFTPANLVGLVGWWSADQGVTTSSGNVTAVNDLSGNGNNLVNSGTVPFNATGFNGKPTFAFVAANNAALTNNAATMNMGSASPAVWSVFGVLNMTGSTAVFGGYFTMASAGGNDFTDVTGGVAGSRQSSSNGIETFLGSGGGTDTAISLNTNYRYGIILTGAAANQYLNGSLSTVGSEGGSQVNSTALIMAIGNRIAAGAIGTNSWDGAISEVFIVAGDVTAQVTNIDNYLKTHWALP